MMRDTLLSAGALLTFTAITLPHAYSAEPDWEAKYKEVCDTEVRLNKRQLCGKLKKMDGTWIKPKPEVMEALKVLKDEIRKAGNLFDPPVDPRSIAGAIMTENSLNQTIGHDIEDFLVKTGLAKGGKIPILNRKFTFGWGQLHEDTAVKAEPLLAAREGRPVRTQAEVEQAMLVPAECMKYVAAVIALVQDAYKNRGLFEKIQNRPELLATLYNLGNAEQHADETLAEKRDPKINYFGLFVERYIPELEAAVGKPDVRKAVVAPVAETKAPKEAPVVEAPAKKPAGKEVEVTVATKAIALTISPKTCNANGTEEEAEYLKWISLKTYPSSGAIKPGTSFEEVAPGLGCGLEKWVLVRAADGTQGWAPREALEKSQKKEKRADVGCKLTVSAPCEAKITKATGKQLLEKQESGQYAVKLVGRREAVNWKKFGGKCSEQQLAAANQIGNVKPLTLEEANKLRGEIEKFKTKVLDVINTAREEQANKDYDVLQKKYEQDNAAYQKEQDDYREASDEWWKKYGGLAKPPLPQPKSPTLARPWPPAKQAPSKLTAFNDSNNPYWTILSYESPPYFGSLTKCAQAADGTLPAVECRVDTKKVQDALASEIKPYPSYTEFMAVMQKFSAITVTQSSLAAPAVAKDAEKAIAEKRAKFKKLLEACIALAKGNVDAEAYLNRIMTAIDTYPLNTQIWQSEGNLSNLGTQCSNLADLLDGKTSNNGWISCCQLYQSTPQNGGCTTILLSLQVVKNMIKTPEDKNRLLEAMFKGSVQEYALYPAAQVYNPGNGNQLDPADCSYDPFKTAKFIEDLLKDPCVGTVFVPDPWLLARLASHGKRVIYRPFIEDDRFMVESGQTKCGGNLK